MLTKGLGAMLCNNTTRGVQYPPRPDHNSWAASQQHITWSSRSVSTNLPPFPYHCPTFTNTTHHAWHPLNNSQPLINTSAARYQPFGEPSPSLTGTQYTLPSSSSLRSPPSTHTEHCPLISSPTGYTPHTFTPVTPVNSIPSRTHTFRHPH